MKANSGKWARGNKIRKSDRPAYRQSADLVERAISNRDGRVGVKPKTNRHVSNVEIKFALRLNVLFG